MWNVGTSAKDYKFVLEVKFQTLAKKKRMTKARGKFCCKSCCTNRKGKDKKIEI